LAPAVESVDWLSEEDGNHSDIGAARRCNFHDGSSIVETCIEIQDSAEASLVRFAVTEFSAPAKALVMFMKLVPDGEKSIVTIGMEFEPIDANTDDALKDRFETSFKMVAVGIESYIKKGTVDKE
jgi:hypothetical protein